MRNTKIDMYIKICIASHIYIYIYIYHIYLDVEAHDHEMAREEDQRLLPRVCLHPVL